MRNFRIYIPGLTSGPIINGQLDERIDTQAYDSDSSIDGDGIHKGFAAITDQTGNAGVEYTAVWWGRANNPAIRCRGSSNFTQLSHQSKTRKNYPTIENELDVRQY